MSLIVELQRHDVTRIRVGDTALPKSEYLP